MQGTNYRIEVVKNDGQNSSAKPIVVKPNTDLQEVMRLCSNAHKIKSNPASRLWTIQGTEINNISEVVPNQKYCISLKCEDFIPVTLKKNALVGAPKTCVYTAVFLDVQSIDLLIKMFKPEIPNGWKTRCDHMTITQFNYISSYNVVPIFGMIHFSHFPKKNRDLQILPPTEPSSSL